MALRASDRRELERRPRRPFLHMPVPWVFVLAYLAGVLLQWTAPTPAASSTASLVIRTAGLLVFAGGWVLIIWSQILFKRVATTTVPGEAASAVVVSGPYRTTRNPMYVGLTLVYLGEAGLLVQAWPLVFLPLALAYVNWFVIPTEEATLARMDGYAQYRVRVRRWL